MKKWKRYVGYLVVVFTLAISLTGCGSGKSALIGSWVPENGDHAPGGFPDNVEFYSDGTCNWDDEDVNYSVESGRIKFSAWGQAETYDYKINGSKLTLTDDDGDSVTYVKENNESQTGVESEAESGTYELTPMDESTVLEWYKERYGSGEIIDHITDFDAKTDTFTIKIDTQDKYLTESGTCTEVYIWEDGEWSYKERKENNDFNRTWSIVGEWEAIVDDDHTYWIYITSIDNNTISVQYKYTYPWGWSTMSDSGEATVDYIYNFDKFDAYVAEIDIDSSSQYLRLLMNGNGITWYHSDDRIELTPVGTLQSSDELSSSNSNTISGYVDQTITVTGTVEKNSGVFPTWCLALQDTTHIQDQNGNGETVFFDCDRLFFYDTNDFDGTPISAFEGQLVTVSGVLENYRGVGEIFLCNPSLNSQLIADGNYIIATQLNTIYVLDIYGAGVSDGDNLQLAENNNTAAQSFTVTYLGDGYYKIINANSEKAVSAANSSALSGTNVCQWSYNTLDNQIWEIISTESGSYNIICKASGMYLDVDNAYAATGTNVKLFDKNDGYDAQKWIFTKVS
jgi:DNA/RNA endonuclease YhcR with UshA esterase domain